MVGRLGGADEDADTDGGVGKEAVLEDCGDGAVSFERVGDVNDRIGAGERGLWRVAGERLAPNVALMGEREDDGVKVGFGEDSGEDVGSLSLSGRGGGTRRADRGDSRLLAENGVTGDAKWDME